MEWIIILLEKKNNGDKIVITIGEEDNIYKQLFTTKDVFIKIKTSNPNMKYIFYIEKNINDNKLLLVKQLL